MEKSIFQKYYSEEPFIDAFLTDKERAIDVIIPVLNTNELWEADLYSFYREIPINRLLIGNGGVTDNTLDVLKAFPRVEIIELKGTSLGYRIAKLMQQVTTDFFIYLHSDVYLPSGWFDKMYKYKDEYDWFECYRTLTVLVEINSHNQNKEERALSGTQFGKTEKMKSLALKIDDDYSYRQEDIIFAELLKEAGGKYGRISDTFHYHQIMNKVGAEVPNYKSFEIEREENIEVEKMIWNTQARGIIKYLKPKKYLIDMTNKSLYNLDQLNGLDWNEFKSWVKKINPVWLQHVSRRGTTKQRVISILKNLFGR
jgi:hypothetical protein